MCASGWFAPSRFEWVGLLKSGCSRCARRCKGREHAGILVERPRSALRGSFLVDEYGKRYVDFLIPGLLGTSLMGGGLWGVGFAIVDLRLRKVLSER